MKGTNGIDLPQSPQYDHTHAWHLFVIKVLALDRDKFMNRLAEYNIGYGLHFPPAHTLSYIKERYVSKIGSLRETERAGDKIVSLPLFPDMRQEDVQYVCTAIKQIVNHG
jgi:dTDP-4-amino-4,6-dideoxygalactose transaminase